MCDNNCHITVTFIQYNQPELLYSTAHEFKSCSSSLHVSGREAGLRSEQAEMLINCQTNMTAAASEK